MKLGFTGTRDGMTDAQKIEFVQRVGIEEIDEFHHGCCVGADEDAVHLIQSTNHLGKNIRIVGHPPTDRKLVSEYAEKESDELREPAVYLIRNRNIVGEVDTLIACPKGPITERSGTWTTVKYFAQAGKSNCIVIYPNDEIKENRNG